MKRPIAKVLVTGATGFIGQHLVEALLRRNIEVRCLYRNLKYHPGFHPLFKALDIEWVMGDTRDFNSLLPATQGVEAVFHLAGRTSALSRREMVQINGKGTGNVAHACAACETPPVHLVVSSISAVGPTRVGVPRTEADEAAPISNYGRSKLIAERGATLYASQVPTTIVRPGIVFGERDRELLPVFRSIDRFRVHLCPNFRSSQLSLIYVEDLVELLIRAAEVGERVVPNDPDAKEQGYYFACADTYPTYAELGRMIAQALGGSPVCVLPLLQPIPWIVGYLSEWKSYATGRASTLTRDKIREANAPSWACSPARSERQLGFAPHRPIVDQLRQTVQWYREQRWL